MKGIAKGQRRVLVLGLGSLALVNPLVALAQNVTRVWRIGFLVAGSKASLGHLLEALRQGLHELGYVEPRNLVIEARWGDGRMERLADLATQLVHLKVDLIVAGGAPAVEAAKSATKIIPIVMGAVTDPIGLGFATSLARPGGNITGLSNMADETTGKLVELAREIIPNAEQAAVLLSGDPASTMKWEDAQRVGAMLKLRLIALKAANQAEIGAAFAEMTKAKAAALIVPADTFLNTQRKTIVELAAKHRLPAVYARREYANDGGLVSYGLSLTDLFRRCAAYADRILKGAKPGDLPIEQPAKFELVINLRAARALGLTVPQSIFLRADAIIE